MASQQVIITSTLHSQNCSLCVQDFCSGNQIKTIKEGIICGQNCLISLFDQYILACQKDSSVLHLWSNKKQLHSKWRAPGKVTSLVATPDSYYIIVGIAEKIFIYQTASGKLVSTLHKHFQPVTCLRMSKCGTFFLSGGEDGLALVWLLFSVIKSSLNHEADDEPMHIWSDHTSKITDIHCGGTGIQGKCCTVSIDSTCKIYEIFSGQQLVSIVFDEPLWSVVMDSANNYLYVGGEKGSIFETALYDRAQVFDDMTKPAPVILEGHKAKVTHLCISFDALALVSGSNDGKVIVWHTRSRQQMKIYEYKGAITNLLVLPTPYLFHTDDFKFHPVKPFEISPDRILDNLERDVINILPSPVKNSWVDSLFGDEEGQSVDSHAVEKFKQTEKKVEDLSKINQQLYSFIVDSIFKTSTTSVE